MSVRETVNTMREIKVFRGEEFFLEDLTITKSDKEDFIRMSFNQDVDSIVIQHDDIVFLIGSLLRMFPEARSTFRLVGDVE